MPLLEDWGIANRLCSLQGYAGCFDGYVTDLARIFLQNMSAAGRQDVEVFSCGPTPMLKAVASLAAEFELPERPRPLLIGGGVGIPPMVFLADDLRDDRRTGEGRSCAHCQRLRACWSVGF